MTRPLIKLGQHTEIKDCLVVGLNADIDTAIEVSENADGNTIEDCIMIGSYKDSFLLRWYMWWNHTRKKWR